MQNRINLFEKYGIAPVEFSERFNKINGVSDTLEEFIENVKLSLCTPEEKALLIFAFGIITDIKGYQGNPELLTMIGLMLLIYGAFSVVDMAIERFKETYEKHEDFDFELFFIFGLGILMKELGLIDKNSIIKINKN